MTRKTLEISLDRLEIQQNGEFLNREGRNVLSASLVYPAPGRPLLTTMKSLKLEQNQTIDFATGADPVTKKPYTWSDRLLFKEDVVERALLTVQLTDVVTAPAFEKFVAAVFGSAATAAWAAFTGGIGNVALAGAAEAIGAAHLDSLKIDGDTVYVLGATSIEIDLAQSLPLQATRDLIVPAAVDRYRDVFVGATNQVTRERLHLDKGVVNGRIVIGVREL
jgi:hypothetical protein